jgi:hypothetical protein
MPLEATITPRVAIVSIKIAKWRLASQVGAVLVRRVIVGDPPTPPIDGQLAKVTSNGSGLEGLER